ncbi:MAG: TlpA family protein disulfide reductase [Clostridiales bacterium]|jgi:thiol-disulfide isomerase/thioredoxin|nr:TlpA family protein disulfide reductase [Clostridiales bacterium]
MNEKAKAAAFIIGFALLISFAVFAYNYLSRQTAPSIEIAGGRDEILQQGQESTDSASDPEAEKISAPDFTVWDADGNSFKLSDLAGKPVVLNFWASWCPPCKSEMPEFNEVYREIGNDVAFMMVDLVDGQRETKEAGAKHVEDQGFSFPVYYDASQEAAYSYGIASIPTTFFIDKDGYIVTGAQGAISAETLRKGIELIK